MKHKKPIGIAILLGVVVLVASAGLVLGVLETIKPTRSHGESSTTQPGPTATTVLNTFLKQSQQTEQLKNMGIGLLQNAQPAMYFVKSDSPNTYIGLTGTNIANISGTSTLTQATLSNIEAGVTDALKHQGFEKQTTPTLPSIVATYQASDTYCSLLGAAGTTQLNLICADKVEYGDALASTQSLLKQWNGLSGATYTYTTSQTVKNNDGSYQLASIVLINGNNQALTASLVYTKKGSEGWQYAANLVASSHAPTGGGKIIQTPEVEKVMNDSNYGPLLNKILGTTDPRV